MREVLTELYETYKKPIYTYLYRATLNSHTAEELTQDTFLKAFKSFGSFRGDASAKTWLFKIARNTYLTFMKKNDMTLEENVEDILVGDTKDQYAEMIEKMIIKTILLWLPEKERSLIVLRDINGLTYTEIAGIMNYTEGQVKVGLHRARKKFKEQYTKACREER